MTQRDESDLVTIALICASALQLDDRLEVSDVYGAADGKPAARFVVTMPPTREGPRIFDVIVSPLP